MISKTKIQLSKDEIERIKEEELKRDKMFDTFMAIMTVILIIGAIATYIAGDVEKSYEFGVLSVVSLLFTAVSIALTNKKKKVFRRMLEVAEKNGKVEILAEVNFANVKIVE